MSSKPHVVIFPFMAQGHTIPVLDLSKALSRRGLRVTIITTPRNASSMKPYISQPHSKIELVTIPFPSDVQGLPHGCENMSQTRSPGHVLAFMNATKLLREPFEAALKAMMASGREDAPTCVVSDSFLGWTNASCRKLGIPRLVFNGMGVFAMAVKKSLSIHKAYESGDSAKYGGDDDDDGERVEVKLGTEPSFDITTGDLPRSLRVSDCEISKFYLEAEMSDLGSWAVIANSFVELEKGYVSALEELYGNGSKTFCVGPLFLYDQMWGEVSGVGPIGLNWPSPNTEWANWLTRRGEERENSVMYVSFGSQVNLCDEQLDELAHGLELSGENYIWIVHSESWTNPTDVFSGGTKGLVVREWVDQKWVLAHRAIGGFLSHCGWNSALESLANGVPLLAWPMHAEQHLNAKFLVNELKVGIGLEGGSTRDGKVVSREAICKGVKALMRGKQARENAIEYGRKAKRAIQVGGSSYNRLNEIVQLIHEEKMRASSVENGERIKASDHVASCIRAA